MDKFGLGTKVQILTNGKRVINGDLRFETEFFLDNFIAIVEFLDGLFQILDIFFVSLSFKFSADDPLNLDFCKPKVFVQWRGGCYC